MNKPQKYYRSDYLLMNCNPLMIIPVLACVIGLREAIMAAQLHYWLCKNRENASKKHYHDGRWWTYGSVRYWKEDNFPFWCEKTIERGFQRLESMGLIETANYNSMRNDATKWYTLNYERFLDLFPNENLMLDPITNQIINKQQYEEEMLYEEE